MRSPIRQLLCLTTVLGAASATSVAQVEGNPPSLTIIRWAVTHIQDITPIVVYDRDLNIGTPDSVFEFDHLEADLIEATIDVTDPDWIEPITQDPNTGELQNDNEEVWLRLRAFGYEIFAPPSPTPIPLAINDFFPEEDGFRPLPGPTTPYHFFFTFEFELPEFIGRNQRRLNGQIDFDVAYLLEFCATNEKPEAGENGDPAITGCFGQDIRVLENPTLRPPNPQAFADAGRDQTVAAGTTVILDGSRTFDSTNLGFNPDDPNIFERDQIIFAWEWISGPVRVDPVQDGPNNPLAEVTLNTLGTYVYRLTVDDGSSTSLPTSDIMQVLVLESLPAENAPTAVITGPASGVPIGAIITLDGSQSFDPDGDALNFRWRQTNELGEPLTGADLLAAFQPLSGVESSISTWQAVNAGTFYFRLLVDDGQFLVNATFTVRVIDPTTSGRTEVEGSQSGEESSGDVADALDAVGVPACGAGIAPLAMAPLALLLFRRRGL